MRSVRIRLTTTCLVNGVEKLPGTELSIDARQAGDLMLERAVVLCDPAADLQAVIDARQAFQRLDQAGQR
jgi:hypothetical protein